MKDAEEFFRKNVEIKAKQRGWNSFVAPHNRHTYQVDLTFVRFEDFEKKRETYTYSALTCIDVLSKYAVAIPLENKELRP
jgi:hypothetical protein